MLLSICEFGENRRREALNFRIEIKLRLRMYLDTVWLSDSEKCLVNLLKPSGNFTYDQV
jgi:hypothetical protein